jgi:hypothetical protein
MTNDEVTNAFFAHDALKREHQAARRKLDADWQERIDSVNSLLLNLVATEGQRLATFQPNDILVTPKDDIWVVLYVSGKVAQLPNLQVKVVPEYEMQRLQKSGYLGKTVEKFAGAAIKGWRKQGTMSRDKIEAFWEVNRQGQRKRRAS